MITSQTGYGKIHAGDTELGFTSEFSQPGPADLAITAGTYTATNGTVHPISSQQITLSDGNWRIELGWFDGQQIGVHAIPISIFPPDDWHGLQILAGYGAGIQVQAGEIVGDVYVLEVLPGFPV